MNKTQQYLLSAILGLSAVSATASDALLKEARSTTMMFGKTLKSEVMQSMKAGGPVPTISMCSDRAPQIAKELSTKSGWNVGRTSLKLRNPKNAPDAWELAVLKDFEQRKAKGEPLKTMEFSQVVETENGKVFRFMKPIPTGKPCLHCHAATIKPETENALKVLYPQDKARGFKEGDIRGAFTLSKSM